MSKKKADSKSQLVRYIKYWVGVIDNRRHPNFSEDLSIFKKFNLIKYDSLFEYIRNNLNRDGVSDEEAMNIVMLIDPEFASAFELYTTNVHPEKDENRP